MPSTSTPRWLRAEGDERPIGVIRSADRRRPDPAPLGHLPAAGDGPTSQSTRHSPRSVPAAPASEPPAEVAGEIVTAAQCRELLEQLDMLGVRAAPEGGCVLVAVGDPVTGRLVAVGTRNELRRGAGIRRRRTRRGGRRARTPAHIPRSAPSPEPALEMGRPPRTTGPGSDRPAATTAYRSTPAQGRFTRTRDRTCRMPGCRRAPAGATSTMPSRTPTAGRRTAGTSAASAAGTTGSRPSRVDWRFQLLADGRLIVRTPSGVSRDHAPTGLVLRRRARPTLARRGSTPGRAPLLSVGRDLRTRLSAFPTATRTVAFAATRRGP